MNLLQKIALIYFFKKRRLKHRRKLYTVNRHSGIIMLNNTLYNFFLCQQFLRLTPDTLVKLTELMSNSIIYNFITKIEIICIGLHFLGQNPTVRDQCALFGLSNNTIRKCRNIFIDAIIIVFGYYFNHAYWILNQVFDYIPENSSFNGVFGALDGTHIPIRVSSKDTERYRNRKGFISTNTLILCDFRMNIIFCCSGLEGSAHDSFVLNTSNLNSTLNLLPNEYFILGDAGYGITERILTPFRSTRYNLKEYSRENGPANYKELFNLRHSKLRNIIERTIGILKRRWCILRTPNESLNRLFIKRVIISCCLLHNFLISQKDMNIDDSIVIDEINTNSETISTEHTFDSNQTNAGKFWRDSIAREMWSQYNN